ncbi:MAG: GDP-mannose 4,6-dehydratase [Verrucomicrobiota bacterium]
MLKYLSKKAIIFGAGGQDGYYLTKLLRELGLDVIGVVRKNPRDGQVIGDVADRSFVESLISSAGSDYIFQLAAISSIDERFFDANYKAIVEGALNVLRAVYSTTPDSRVFIPGSALQFVNEGKTLNEDSERVSENHYSLARNQSLEIARYYRTKGVRAYFGYLFHHDSPRRRKNHVAQMISTFAREFEEGQKTRLEIRDPSFQKEWTFAGDIVRAMWALVNNDTYFEAVVGSGELHSISDWIDHSFEIAGIDREKYLVSNSDSSSPKPYRSNPVLLKSLGWEPEVGFVEFCEMMMAHGSSDSQASF